jgi:hypothetical protein
MRIPLRSLLLAAAVLALPTVALHAATASHDPRLAGAYTFHRGGWTYVHLQGSPASIGYQHGYLLGPRILDNLHVYQVETLHDTKRPWQFYRDASKNMLWPHIPIEYRQEMEGIAQGAQARGVHVDVWDIVALNAMEELPGYYVPWLDKQQHKAVPAGAHPKDHCSAFIATGSYTKDGKIVMAHNNWSPYAEGERWTMMFDIEPTHGHRILQDGEPGVIVSDDDFGINSAGIMSTETTIEDFQGWNPSGVPEFVRARQALQYANSIDQYVSLMEKGNNGGYANDWLIGDRKTGEIAYLELGLQHVHLWRSKSGYFVSSNFARDPGVLKDETPGFNYNNLSFTSNARRVRWQQLMEQYKGRIDVQLAEQFEADHFDSWTHKETPDQRTLCGHVDQSPHGMDSGWGPYYPAGAVQGKVTSSDLAARMELIAHAGHPCGQNFYAKPFLAAHPEYSWMKSILGDMIAGPWTEFQAGETAPATTRTIAGQ